MAEVTHETLTARLAQLHHKHKALAHHAHKLAGHPMPDQQQATNPAQPVTQTKGH